VCGKLPKVIILQQNFAVEMCRRSHIFFKNYENSHGHRENFLMGIFSEKNGILPKKILRKISNIKFFTVDPYFGYTFNMGFPKMAKKMAIFRHKGGVTEKKTLKFSGSI
jgi:hypothetical protein